MSLGACGLCRLVFNEARTAFSASAGRGLPPSSQGVLDTPQPAAGSASARKDDEDEGDEDDDAAAVAARWRTDLSDSRIYRRLLGSGPWSWQGVSPLAFLGGGVLSTP